MNIAMIVQARMESVRLPGKVLKTIREIPMIEYQLLRLNEVGVPYILATTDKPKDDLIEKFCQDRKTPIFRGSENNVLERYYFCAKEFKIDTVIRITGDCPLIAPEVISLGIDKYTSLNNNQSYVSNCVERTYPRGFDFEIFSFELLEWAYLNATKDFQTEHVTPAIYNKPINSGAELSHITQKNDDSNYRLTVDTPEDFNLIKELIEVHNAHLLTGDEIIKVLKENKELNSINSHIQQKNETWDE